MFTSIQMACSCNIFRSVAEADFFEQTMNVGLS